MAGMDRIRFHNRECLRVGSLQTLVKGSCRRRLARLQWLQQRRHLCAELWDSLACRMAIIRNGLTMDSSSVVLLSVSSKIHNSPYSNRRNASNNGPSKTYIKMRRIISSAPRWKGAIR